MTLLYKRILILFSVALNLGFIAMALSHAYQRPVHNKDHRWRALMGIVEKLDLPEAKAEQAVAMMTRFRTGLDEMDKQLRNARMQTLDYLATPGPVERARLHALIMAAEQVSREKQTLFEAHVASLRQVLGDEDGARFFAALKARILAKRNTPRE